MCDSPLSVIYVQGQAQEETTDKVLVGLVVSNEVSSIFITNSGFSQASFSSNILAFPLSCSAVTSLQVFSKGSAETKNKPGVLIIRSFNHVRDW